LKNGQKTSGTPTTTTWAVQRVGVFDGEKSKTQAKTKSLNPHHYWAQGDSFVFFVLFGSLVWKGNLEGKSVENIGRKSLFKKNAKNCKNALTDAQ